MIKKEIIAILFSALLLTSSCAPTKNIRDKCYKEKTEVVVVEDDPIMKLLISGLIIYAINLMIQKPF